MKFAFALMIGLALTLSVGGCSKQASSPSDATQASTGFETPEAAIEALVAAVEKNDSAALKALLGSGTQDLISSGDEVQDRAEREAFVARYREKHALVAGGPDDQVLQVGADDWPMPIPLVRKNGQWYFDGEAGANEVVVRRIGANELRTIDVMRGYVQAQDEYASVGRDGGQPGVYAQRLRSQPGKHDGLYWEAVANEPQSPAGPFLADASAEGYDASKNSPYHGYIYRVLSGQGAAANGGAREYVVDSKQTGGFALIAWPANYGASGIMTFMVNQDGVVWQRDLGDDTADIAAAIAQFDPDETWTPIATEADQSDEPVARANPASENCIQQGGNLRIEKTPRGDEYGVCTFEDNYQCEEWALLRGECRAGGVRVTGYLTDAARFCAITGGRYVVTSDGPPEQGTCTFRDRSCNADAYYRGDCGRNS
ncbi:putative hemolysin [Povalibacter uvarum]|uniref:Putative hemolysin n=1 Tax=Povalibacter uvarum TaxID=732238 RepID=A0A841HPJ5_9GAMM|nr:DUF2950 family protein [Povalibacter uvarum]MBB6095241.1 putative hemolysin [Povalibacter uvarum]